LRCRRSASSGSDPSSRRSREGTGSIRPCEWSTLEKPPRIEGDSERSEGLTRIYWLAEGTTATLTVMPRRGLPLIASLWLVSCAAVEPPAGGTCQPSCGAHQI